MSFDDPSSTRRNRTARSGRAGRLLKSAARAAVAGLVAAGMFAAPLTAMAGMGSGGSGATGSGGLGPNGDLLYVADTNLGDPNGNPVQGWGDASIEYAINRLRASGYQVPGDGYQLHDSIYSTCREAISNAVADKSDGPADKARVVGLAATLGQTNTLTSWGTNPGDFRNRFEKNWSYLAQDGMGNDLVDWSDEWVNRLHTKFNDQITATGQQYPTGVSLVCVAVNNYQPPAQNYDLTITTDQQAAAGIKVGSTDAVRDLIHAVSSTGKKEDLQATVWLNYDGNAYVNGNAVSKKATITSHGDTMSPEFKPSDFGWSHWQEGNYWFDIDVAKQGGMSQAVNTADREASETYRVVSMPPTDFDKQVEEGVSADSMTNRTVITSGTGAGGYEITFKDVITPNGVDYTVSNMKVVDKTDNDKDISGQFAMNWDQASNTVTAVRTADQGEMPIDHEWAFSFDVTVSLPEGFQNVEDKATVSWNQEPEVEAGTGEFPTWTPNPDKSWILMGADGEWQAVIDPDETNTTGADQHKFLDGDKVASAVNATVGANLIEAPEQFTIEDDWSAADYIFDAGKASEIRVYQAEAGTDRESSVSDIANKGEDVTDMFDITLEGTKAVATAKKEYRESLKGLAKPLQVTMIVPGVINFANGEGAQQVREDFGRQPGDELTFCTNPTGNGTDDGAHLTNAGAQTVNGQRVETNEPWICGYVPPVKKAVIAEGSEGGDQGDANGTVVFPGQRVEYQLTTSPQLPGDMAYQVTEVAVTDTYSQWLEIDKQTLEVTDLASGRIIPMSDYTRQWDDDQHTFRLVFSDSYVRANWQPGQRPSVMIRFEGTVSKDAPTSEKAENEWGLTLNNSLTPSNKVENLPPDITPGKEDTQKDPSISIDGKTALLGDVIYYRVHIDATKLTDTAYKVWRLGMVDDYDEEYLRLDRRGIQILDETGRDRTAEFNVSDHDGVLYAFARTVDTEIPATGETIPGDPQPQDLKAYSELTDEDHDPLRDPAIDQSLLGHDYTVVMPMSVIKVTDGYVVENTATQVTNDQRDVTNTVTNPLEPINPSKDVTVQVGGDSVDGHSIWLDRTFLYQLDSSILPADRAYPEITEWRIEDPLDTAHDRYTGQWAVYATRDLHRDDQVIAAKGDMIAGSDFDPATLGLDGQLFTVGQAEDGTVTVEATHAYLDLVSADNEHENGFRAYIQCQRIAVGEQIANKFWETINGTPRESNEVHTNTPDMTPSISLEKWDEASGFPEGDRDRSDDALNIQDETTTIVFTITNTSKTDPDTGVGAWFKASDLRIEDSTIVGDGEIVDWQYPENWDSLVLKPGDSVDVKATLKGVTDKHTDRASVSGVPLLPCTPDTDDDPFDTGQCGDDDTAGDQTDGDGQGGAEGETPEDQTDGEGQTVTIDGETLCGDTIVVSNTDDWNGYKERLAITGSTVAVVIGLMVLLLAGGSVIVIARRRTGAGAHTPAGNR